MIVKGKLNFVKYDGGTVLFRVEGQTNCFRLPTEVFGDAQMGQEVVLTISDNDAVKNQFTGNAKSVVTDIEGFHVEGQLKKSAVA